MVIVIGCDHAALSLKKEIIRYFGGIEVMDNFGAELLTGSDETIKFIDVGCQGETVDYPDIAEKVCNKVIEFNGKTLGILCCGTGIGMSIAANKINGIRAAVCTNTYSAKFTRLHNNANVLCLGSRVTGEGLAVEIAETFINTRFEGGRHAQRVEKIAKLEKIS